jgi:uncharacterized membrane protein
MGDNMRLWKRAVLFYFGGAGYLILEILWRGWTHGSMFLVGGVCFLLLGELDKTGMPLAMESVLGAVLVTAVELCSGLIINRALGLNVWDYSDQPYQFLGQICLPYFFLWVWVALGAAVLYQVFQFLLFQQPLQRRRIF